MLQGGDSSKREGNRKGKGEDIEMNQTDYGTDLMTFTKDEE